MTLDQCKAELEQLFPDKPFELSFGVDHSRREPETYRLEVWAGPKSHASRTFSRPRLDDLMASVRQWKEPKS